MNNFYSDNEIMIPLDFNLKNRFVKVRSGKKWTQANVRNSEELRKLCLDSSAEDVYISAGRWLQPRNVIGKYFRNGKLIPYIMIGSYMVIDIDSKHFPKKTMSEARNEMIKINDYLIKLGLDNNLFERTGNGYQIFVRKWEEKFIEKKIPKLKERYRYYEERRRKFVNMLKKKSFIFDVQISLDNHRVVRCPNTVHRNGTITRIASDPYDNVIL